MGRANKSRNSIPYTPSTNGHANGRFKWVDHAEGTRAGDGRDWRDVRDEMGPVKLNGHGSLGINGRAKGPGQGVAPERVYLRPDQVVIDTPGQVAFAEALRTHRIIFGFGSAGAGKTFLAVRDAVEKLQSGRVKGIVFIRPAVEAGDTLGFQPGDIDSKISGYMEPMLNELGKFYSPAAIKGMRADKVLRTLALQFLQGYNLEDMAVILDESQNATAPHVQLLLQRICRGTSIAILGDVSHNQPDHPAGPVLKQSFLKPELQGGVEYWAATLDGIKGIRRVDMTPLDCHRDPLLKEMQGRGL